jgi:hypothetical protein
MKPKKTKVWLAPHEARPVPIVADAAISRRGAFGGRLVPLLILDTTNRSDIDELIRVHHTLLKPGDVKTQWAERDDHDGSIALVLTFVRPVEAKVIIEFDIAKQGLLVEQALSGKGLYLQSGRAGDRLIKDHDRPKVLLEIVDTGFGKNWDGLFHKHLAKHFRTKGLSRSDAKQAARSTIEELRKLDSFRMRDLPVPPGAECGKEDA